MGKISNKYLKLASKQSNHVFGLEYNGRFKFLKSSNFSRESVLFNILSMVRIVDNALFMNANYIQ